MLSFLQSLVGLHPISHPHRTSSTVSTLFADNRDLISVTEILWTNFFSTILLLDPNRPNRWMDPTHVYISDVSCWCKFPAVYNVYQIIWNLVDSRETCCNNMKGIVFELQFIYTYKHAHGNTGIRNIIGNNYFLTYQGKWVATVLSRR